MSHLPPIGIVAGWGSYPIAVARSLKEQGRAVVVAALHDHADPVLGRYSDAMRWFGVARLGGHQRLFQQHGVEQVVLAGKLFKDRLLYHGRGWIGLLPDWTTFRACYDIVVTRRASSGDDSYMTAVVQSFARRGMQVVPGTDFAPQLLVEEGCLTDTRPAPAVMSDIEFAWPIAKSMGGMDIGQSVTVRDRAILAVEAIEGTDACIDRTGQLCPRGGFTLVKVAKPQQDRRFDLPTIGLRTIERLQRAGGRAIAIEAGQTILVDRDQVLAAADRAGIAIVSLK